MFETPPRRLAMPRALFLLAAASLSLVRCPELLAQQAAIRVGEPVRVEWTDAQQRHRVAGTVLELPSDSLVLRQSADVWRFALAGLKHVEVRVPRSHARGAARGAGLGALIGLAA